MFICKEISTNELSKNKLRINSIWFQSYDFSDVFYNQNKYLSDILNQVQEPTSPKLGKCCLPTIFPRPHTPQKHCTQPLWPKSHNYLYNVMHSRWHVARQMQMHTSITSFSFFFPLRTFHLLSYVLTRFILILMFQYNNNYAMQEIVAVTVYLFWLVSKW